VLIQGPKRFVRFPGAGHNDLGARGAVDVAKLFLNESQTGGAGSRSCSGRPIRLVAVLMIVAGLMLIRLY
jgi:hypothetical protein